ncbi:MAG: dUTP diphosphatase [Clostridia bacterium]|nr:dUTP diphosphatase [Clostridia bacterium]
MKNMTLNFIKLDPDAIVPTYGTQFAAGADLYALPKGDILIKAGETTLIHTGIALQIPEGYAGFIFARSGIATKRGLAPANKVGVIDSDYRGEIMVSIHNHSAESQTIASGERVAQLVIMPYVSAEFTECQTLEKTDRAEGGFGSTGTK